MNKKPKAVIVIGVPGSGKSTLMAQFVARNGYEYFDYDQVKSLHSELVAETEINKSALWDYIRSQTATLLGNGKTVVLDATFAGYTFRRKFIHFLREAGASRVHGVYMNVPVDVAVSRAAERHERPVDRNSITYYQELIDLHRPSISDGFDALFEMNEYSRLVSAVVARRLSQDAVVGELHEITRLWSARRREMVG